MVIQHPNQTLPCVVNWNMGEGIATMGRVGYEGYNHPLLISLNLKQQSSILTLPKDDDQHNISMLEQSIHTMMQDCTILL